MNRQKTKHLRSEKNLDKLLTDSFSGNEGSKITKMSMDGSMGGCGPCSFSLASLCGMNFKPSLCHVVVLLILIVTVATYYKVLENATYTAHLVVEDWGPSEMAMLIGGIASVAINCWTLLKIVMDCSDNCCVAIVMTVSNVLLGLVFPYILLLVAPTAESNKHALWALLSAHIMAVWVYFYTCSCLDRNTRMLFLASIAWMTYLVVWFGTVLKWEIF